MQEQSQQPSLAVIAPAAAQSQCKTGSHESNGILGRGEMVADKKEASRALHSDRMRQVRNADSEQEREKRRDRDR